jgi:hypothetical protein
MMTVSYFRALFPDARYQRFQGTTAAGFYNWFADKSTTQIPRRFSPGLPRCRALDSLHNLAYSRRLSSGPLGEPHIEKVSHETRSTPYTI